MKKFFTLLALLFVLGFQGVQAEDSTWSFVWNTSKSSGGEGFYNISDHSLFTQVQSLNGLQWTYNGDTYALAYTATSGQYFGTAANPLTHGTLSTSYLKGKIKKVSLDMKVKSADQVATVQVSVGNNTYGTSTLTADRVVYDYTPTGDAAEGDIVLTMDQTSATKGIIYFFSMTITYEGEGVTKPVVEKIGPNLYFALTDMEIESGDGPLLNPITNPYNVSPITYTSSNPDIVAVGKSDGRIFSMGPVGTATITASFAGDDNYFPHTAYYNVKVKEKPVIPAPDVDIKGGTFTEPVTVTITSNDPLCKAIWYSTTLTNVEDLGYDEQTIIVAGNTATVTLDETCTLLCVAVGDNNIGLPATYDFVFNIPLKANFTAEESATPYYNMGWDSIEEASTWKYYGINETNSWTLTEGAASAGAKPFTIIDPKSQYSLSIYYSNSSQRERAVSPEITVRPNSKAEFYACFSGIWLYHGYWSFKVNDITNGTSDVLINSFKWAQDNAFTGPNWEKFSVDLAKYAGHNCTFEFVYEGAGGEDVSIDGFQLVEQNNSADAKIHIMQGQTVHFVDLSQGHPTSWQWTFEGGTPATSNEQNPAVTFNTAGEYTITLVAGKNGETDTFKREKYVVVSVEAPQAHIGIPEGAYLSPWAYAFVPTNVPVTFRDESTGTPDTWAWTFEGTDIEKSSLQNPTVIYKEEGTYGLDLTVSNSAGSDRDFLKSAIHAGGAEDIWNITPDESQALGEVTLGWYGSYGGSNWLGMQSFAEHFDKPMAAATIDNVTTYFNATTADDTTADITVSICLPDESGMPGNAIATTSLKVSELAYDETNIVPTVFQFAEPVKVNSEFFIVISGFPNSGYSDNVALLCAYRGTGKNTAYHYLLDEDENYNFLETGKWYANTDDALSMALTAHLSYDNAATGIIKVNAENNAENINSEVYTINGMRVNTTDKMNRGIYIIRQGHTVKKVQIK